MQVKIGTSKTEINNIASISTITHMLNQTPSVSISVNDDGTLADTVVFGTTQWKNVQFQPIYILENAVYLFIGRVAKVEFTKDERGFNLMVLTCEGASSKLGDIALSKNYIYSEGLVKTANYSGDPDKLRLTDLEGNAKYWVPDDYWTYGKDNAILLSDASSGSFSKTWQVSGNATLAGGMTGFGSYANTLTQDSVYDQGNGVDGSTAEYVVSGTSFADSYKIKKLTVYCVFNVASYLTSMYNITTYFQLLKGSNWHTVVSLQNLGTSGIGIEIKGTDAELKQFLTSESSNYTHIHARFKTAFMFPDADGYTTIKVDYIAIKIDYETASFNPTQKRITDSGTDWIIADDANFYGNGIIGESSAGAKDGDKWQIGENTKVILSECIGATELPYEIDSTLSYYLARSMIGQTPMDVVRDIVDLEDAYWMERYDANGVCYIKIALRTNFGASVYTISDYGTYQQEYPANQYKKVRVWGNQTYAISAIAIDSDTNNTSPLEFTVYNEKINTQQDAQQLADSTLARYKTIRPSLVIELKDVTSLQVGMNVTFNSVVYPIRRIDYSKQYPNGHLRVKVYLGLGQSPPEETLARNIQKALRDAHEAKVDRINVSSSSGIPIISYTNLIDKPTSMTPAVHGNEKHTATYSETSHNHSGTYEPANANIQSHISNTSNPHSVTKAQLSLDNVTNDAQLKRSANDYSAITEKTTTANDDLVLIEDSADSYKKKKVKKSNFAGSGTDANAVHVNAGNEISGLTEKTSLANDDLFIIEDSAASNVKKKVKKSNIAVSANWTRPTSNGYNGVTNTFTASEALSFGDVCYLYSDGGTAKMKKAKADSLTTMMGVAICAETAGIASGSSGLFLFWGFIYNSSWAWTVKDILFVSAATAGSITATAPSTTGQFVQSIGTAIDADTVYFNPNLMYWEVVA